MEQTQTNMNAAAGFSNKDVENAVLGACLLESDAVSDMLAMGLTEQHFTQPLAARAFGAMRAMNGDGEQVDLLSLTERLRGQKDVDVKAMSLFLIGCTTRIASAAHLETHCRILHELFVRRTTAEYGGQLMTASGDGQEDILLKVQELTNSLMDKRFGMNMVHVSQLTAESERELGRRISDRKSGRMSGITTGIRALDRLTNGWQNSALNIIAGRPGMGKTAIALHFALSAAKAGKSVCIYSLEMSGVKITDRMLMALADGMDGTRFRSGEVSADDIDSFQRAMLALRELPIYIDDQPVCTTGYIRSVSRKMKDKSMCDMVVIDYLQLTDMTSGTSRQYNREQQVAKTSREFKILAKELDVPVLLLSQLSRAVEGRGIKKPQLSDLRESGSIEQDADLVAFIYRPEYYGVEGFTRYDADGNFTHGVAQVIVAKQRDGALGETDFCYNRSMTKIWDFDEDISSPAVPIAHYDSGQADEPETEHGGAETRGLGEAADEPPDDGELPF